MSNQTLTFNQPKPQIKLSREYILQEGIGHEDHEREQTLSTEIQRSPLEQGGFISFQLETPKSEVLTGEYKDLDSSVPNSQPVQIDLKQGLTELNGAATKVAEKTGGLIIDVGNAGKELFMKEILGFGQKKEAPKDPKKEAEKANQRVQAQQFTETVTIDIQNVQSQKVKMEQALRVRLLEDVGAVGISEDEANKLLKINTSQRNSLHPSNIVNLREAIKFQQENKKKQQSGGLANTGHKAARGQMETKATQNNEHTGANAQSAVG